MTPVERYFEAEGMNARKLAALLGVHQSHVYRMISGERDSSPDLARKIERKTEGKLSAVDFLASCMTARAAREIARADESHIRPAEASEARENA